jgi:hypothetical protein
VRITYRPYIDNEDLIKETKLEILSASTTQAGSDLFGAVSGGMLKLKGASISAVIRGPNGALHRPGSTTANPRSHNVSLDYWPDLEDDTEAINVLCLLMGKQPYRDMENPLVLKESERATGAYERIGVMAVRSDLEWLQGAVKHILDIV